MDAPSDTCPLCGGCKIPGETTFTAELGFGVVVVRRVPALVCAQCGEDWLEHNVVLRLNDYVDRARSEKQEVAVVGYGS